MKQSFLHGNNRRKTGIAAAGAVVVLLFVFIASKQFDTAEGSVNKSEYFEVQEGPLTISIVEDGTIQSKDQIILKNEVEGQVQIIYLIEEGAEVDAGDLLVELDSSALHDKRLEKEIQVQNAEATYIGARENLAVVENQAKSDISAAELTFQFAQEDLTKYVEGDYPMSLQEAQAKIELAESERLQTQEQLEGSKRLLDEGFLTSIEFDQHKAQAERAKVDLELAEASMALLKEYTYTRQMTELKSAIEEAERALTRARLKANADVVQANAKLLASEAEFQQQKNHLAEIKDQIEKTKIIAPAAGVAIHATTLDSGWRRDEPLAEGQSVRERQELIYLPTADQMVAEIDIHESDLNKVRPGLGVRITVDVLPEQEFTGHIAKIAPLPDAQSIFMNPDLKVYKTRIEIVGDNPALRTGMTCQAEIMVERFDTAIYVPVQSVFMVKGKPTAFVAAGESGFEQREVEMGLDNNRMLRIASGLEPGEHVLMTPPLDIAAIAASELAGGAGGANAFVEAREIAPVESTTRGEARGRSEGAESGGRPGDRAGRGEGGEGGGRGGANAEGGEGPQSGGPGGFGNMSEEERNAMRERFQNMSEEERAKAREERMKNMTPEERAQWEQRRQQRGNRDGQSQQ